MDIASKKVLKSVWLWIWYVMIPPAIIYYTTGELLFNFLGQNLSYLFVIASAICVAVIDSIENEHFYNTIFSGVKDSFWYKRESWNKAKKIFGWKADGWHIFKSLGLISGGFAIVLYKPVISIVWDVVLIGYIFNLTFNAFYNIIFKR